MRIIAKFVLKNLWEKKYRTFLIIFSIMISSALFFATGSLNGTMEKIYLQRIMSSFGTAEIMIKEGDKSPSPRFNPQRINPYKEQMEYIVGILQGTAFYKDMFNQTAQISLLGVNWEEYQLMNPIMLHSEKKLDPFSGRKVIISKATAENYGLRLGDTIEFEINGARIRYNVCALAQFVGPFMDETRGIIAVVPKESLAYLYNEPGNVSVLLMKPKYPEQRLKTIKELALTFKLYSVTETLSKEGLNRQVKPMRIAFSVTSVIVFIMSTFIIYTSFKVITTERLPVIGAFRSLGATKGMTNFILMAESLTYGLIGGIFGGGMGIGLLYIITVVSAPPTLKGFKTTLEFSPLLLLTAALMAVALSFISSIIPIIKVSNMPIKDIVFNSIEKVTAKKIWKLVLAVIFAILIIVVPPLVPKEIAMPVDTMCIVLSMVAIVFAIPFITSGLTKLFEKNSTYLFGNVGALAAQNLRDNKSVLNNIALLAIGVSSILMINTLSYSVIGKLTDYFADMNYNIYFEMSRIDRNFEKNLKAIDGVTATYGIYGAEDVKVAGSHEPIAVVEGIDTDKHLEYLKLEIVDGKQDIVKELSIGRNIILNRPLGYKYQKKIGDLITLELGNGPREYKIIGFINTLTEKGNYAIIAENYFKMDMSERCYSHVLIKTSKDPNEVVAILKKKYIDNRPYVQSVIDDKQGVIKSNEQIFSVLKGFSVLTIILGILGVFNNFIISFIERKRSLAVFRSIGMSKRQIIRMIFIESLTGGFIGGIIGVIGGILMTSVFPYIMEAMDMPIPMIYSTRILVISILTSIAITLVVSISPALKSSKLNIIESLKNE